MHMGELGFPSSNCKEGALKPYTYSIALENSVQECYFSEKLIDCYLTWAFPIYYGCPNLSEYFPKESYIYLDPNVLDNLNEVLERPISRLQKSALDYSRQLVLNKYGIWPTIDRMVNEL